MPLRNCTSFTTDLPIVGDSVRHHPDNPWPNQYIHRPGLVTPLRQLINRNPVYVEQLLALQRDASRAAWRSTASVRDWSRV